MRSAVRRAERSAAAAHRPPRDPRRTDRRAARSPARALRVARRDERIGRRVLGMPPTSERDHRDAGGHRLQQRERAVLHDRRQHEHDSAAAPRRRHVAGRTRGPARPPARAGPPPASRSRRSRTACRRSRAPPRRRLQALDRLEQGDVPTRYRRRRAGRDVDAVGTTTSSSRVADALGQQARHRVRGEIEHVGEPPQPAVEPAVGDTRLQRRVGLR